MRSIIATILSAVAAYAFSFAIDLLLGGLVGVYPNTAYLPVVTWSAIGTVALVLATRATSRSLLLAAPFAVFGALALFGAVIGTHPHSYGVAALLFIQAGIVWRLFAGPTSVAGQG